MYKTWPFQEAKKILDRKVQQYRKDNLINKEIRFETGYGPSGLPHIGTFCEVFRTSMVIAALKYLIKHDKIASQIDFKVKLICFSDDMDGLKKIPSNIPKQEYIKNFIGYPLTSVPDPFDQKSSYGEYMNDKLKSFLDMFGLEYEFMSATEMYKSGQFNNGLHQVAIKYKDVMDIMLPSLRDERQQTYSPFLPICPKTNKVLQAKVVKVDPGKDEITYINEDNEEVITSILNGNVKLQWKVDFAMRWKELEIDYEMYGADHQPNGKLYSSLCKVLGGQAPLQFFYSLFLDSEGNKISKSKGNSISIDEWLEFAPVESLALYAFNSPEKSKRLYFDVIPKVTDDYIKLNQDYGIMLNEYISGFNKSDSINNDPIAKVDKTLSTLDINQQTKESDSSKNAHEQDLSDNAIWLIHNAIFIKSKQPDINNVPLVKLGKINFSLLLNLASACNPDSKEILYGFIKKYDANIERTEFLDRLVTGAILYYEKFVKPNKQYIAADETYRKILSNCLDYLVSVIEEDVTEDDIQNNLYRIGKQYYEPKDLKTFFGSLYQILLGQNQGPRLGSFIKLFGIQSTIELIKSKL